MLVSTNLYLFREEYLVCEFPCLLSSIGGYVGLLFGISIFDIILFFEWIVTASCKTLNSKTKKPQIKVST